MPQVDHTPVSWGVAMGINKLQAHEYTSLYINIHVLKELPVNHTQVCG